MARFLRPEVESIASFFKGGSNDGKATTYMPPGLIIGRIPPDNILGGVDPSIHTGDVIVAESVDSHLRQKRRRIQNGVDRRTPARPLGAEPDADFGPECDAVAARNIESALS